MTDIYKRLSIAEAVETIEYFKRLALHDANSRKYFMGVADNRGIDEEEVPMITLTINIAIGED